MTKLNILLVFLPTVNLKDIEEMYPVRLFALNSILFAIALATKKKFKYIYYSGLNIYIYVPIQL